MDVEDFTARYPRLLHLADAQSWPSIEQRGLLSAAELVRRWEVPSGDADMWLAQKRAELVYLDHPRLGRAVLRDQHPLKDHLLAPALTGGMTVEGWLRLLNSFVFFFTSKVRLDSLHAAYRDVPSVLLTVDTRSLVAAHGARIRLASMNTGYVGRRVKERGADTFLSIRQCDRRARVQEVVVKDTVSDLRDHLISAKPFPGAQPPLPAGP
ncbi:MAG: hypothetical protein H0V19_03880 [Euzebyales bacterium]|nr:hypothetical protein [Euzebyales bacterium]